MDLCSKHDRANIVVILGRDGPVNKRGLKAGRWSPHLCSVKCTATLCNGFVCAHIRKLEFSAQDFGPGFTRERVVS